MSDKPEVEGWRVTRLSGKGYGRERTIVDADLHNAEDPAFWVPEAMKRHSIEPLIRLSDHERISAADKARIAELSDLLLDAKADIQEWLKSFPDANEEPSHRIINRIDAALAQQGKEGGD